MQSDFRKQKANPMKKTILALALVAGLTSFAGNAKANIINANLNETTSSQPIGFGFNNGAITSDYNYGIDGGWENYDEPMGIIGFTYGQYNGSKYYGGGMNPLSFGTRIDSSLALEGGNYWATGVNNNTSGYWGVAFNQGDGNFNYGWVQVQVNDTGMTFGKAAVNTTLNQEIAAGDTGSTAAVPEPSQVAASLLLAAGIAGFVIVKRRKESSELEVLAA